jgi:Zn-dependent protease with chaperone function
MKFVPKELVETADASRGARGWRPFIRGCLWAALILGGGYILLGIAAGILARTIPDEWEAKAFGGAAGALVGDGAAGGGDLDRAQAVFQRLVAAEKLRDLPYTLVLIEMDAPNAVAIPGGTVGVTRGLLDSVKTEEGLAFVLAHELGHHQGRHSLERLGRGLLVSTALALLFGGEGPSAVQSLVGLAESGHSRDQEREADDFGMRLVHRVYGPSEHFLEFFEKMEKEQGAGPGRWSAFFASHPLTSERLEALRELEAALGREGPR